MKHGVRPTREQKKVIQSKGLNVENWLVTKDTPTEKVLVHRHSDKNVRKIYKERKECF